MLSKICTKCITEKPVSDFYKHKGGKHGVKSQCKGCVDARNNAYKENNPDVIAKSRRNQEAKPSVKAYRKSYQQSNRALFRHHNMKRYATKKCATPSWLTEDQLQQISDFYVHARDCEVVTGNKYHVDHIIPLQGENVSGLHVPWNLQVLPADINQSKSNNHAEEWASDTL